MAVFNHVMRSEKENRQNPNDREHPRFWRRQTHFTFSRMVSRTLSVSLGRALRSAARHPVSSPLSLPTSKSDTHPAALAVVRDGCEHPGTHHRDNHTSKRSHCRNRVPFTCTDRHCWCLDRRRLSRRDRQNEWNSALFGTYGFQGNKSQKPTRARARSRKSWCTFERVYLTRTNRLLR
jgi:hypothetical protein